MSISDIERNASDQVTLGRRSNEGANHEKSINELSGVHLSVGSIGRAACGRCDARRSAFHPSASWCKSDSRVLRDEWRSCWAVKGPLAHEQACRDLSYRQSMGWRTQRSFGAVA